MPDHLVVGGTYRSGTTLLQKMLDSHSLLEILYQPFFFFFKSVEQLYARQVLHREIGNLPLGTTAYPPETLPTLLQRVHFGPDEITRFLEQQAPVMSPPAVASDAADRPHPSFLNHLRDHLRPGSARQVFGQLMQVVEAYRNGSDAVYVGFKDIFIDAFMPSLLASFDHLRVIHLVRDPRAILASRNYGRFAQELEPNRHPLLLIARIWQQSVRCRSFMLQHFPDRFFPLTYEALVSNSEEAARHLCTFLGVPFDPAMTDPGSYCVERGGPWHWNTSYADKHTAADSLHRWQERLPNESVGAIEFLCAPEMREAGYVPIFSPHEQQRLFMAYEEDPARLLPWTLQPGLLLTESEKEQLLASRNTSDLDPHT